MSETVEGSRDSRGEWQPAVRPGPAPLFVWPPRPLQTWKFVTGNPGYLFPWNIMFCVVAAATWLYTQPELSQMAEFRVGWIVQLYLRNVALLTVFTGGLHLWLYTFKGQDDQYKYNSRWPVEKSPRFLGGTQLRDNVFWSIVSGCTIWTAYEALMMWAFANDYTLNGSVEWSAHPVYFVVLLGLLMVWQTFHFYFAHRLTHWTPLYRSAHYLHHKNVNISPWTGLSMHPIEHVIYFSAVLIFFFIPSHPIHVMFTLQFAALMSTVGHIGFDKLVVKGKVAFPSDYFHYLHHRHFECNYGNLVFPADKWFGTFHDGSPEAHARMADRLGEKKKRSSDSEK